MAWTEPKTDWSANDYFNVSPDYLRIKGNIEYLRDIGNEMYLHFGINVMQDVSITGLPNATFLNNVEKNVELLAQKTYSPKGFRKGKTYVGDRAGWNYEDMNRIEKNLLLIYQVFKEQKIGRHTIGVDLGITLGGYGGLF